MNVVRRVAAVIGKRFGMLSPVDGRNGGGWISIVRESFTGAWQRNLEINADTALCNNTVFACMTLIAADIGKLRPKLMQYDAEGIGTETQSAAFSPFLRRPNRYQNHIQFKEWWIISKLSRGNVYGLKQRDQRGVVVAVYLLDPCRVQVLVSPDGSVFYQLGEDNLSGLREDRVAVPASEIIHDRMNCLFHPLVGISPLYASGMAADQGLKIQENSANFFGNSSTPGGILIAPGPISDERAGEMKTYWENNYTGAKAGRIAVLGDGLKFEPLRMTAVDSQMLEQLRVSAEMVCSTFHVPAYMVGVGPVPLNNNVEALAQQYYSQCLQTLIESMEASLDDGLGLDTPKDGVQMGIELDLDGLLRMDSATQMATLKIGVDGSIVTPNEARRVLNRKPVKGGDTLYMQQQQFSIEALADRDSDKPFAKPPPSTPAVPAVPAVATDPDKDALVAAIKELEGREELTAAANATALQKVMTCLAAVDARLTEAAERVKAEVVVDAADNDALVAAIKAMEELVAAANDAILEKLMAGLAAVDARLAQAEVVKDAAVDDAGALAACLLEKITGMEFGDA